MTASSGPAPESVATKPQLRWWKEVLIAGTFYFIYSLVRSTFGAGVESRTIAFRHARGIIKVEDALGLWFEPSLQRWYLDLPGHGYIRGWNIFYGTAHFAVTMGVLLAAFFMAPRVYLFARTALAATTLLALGGFAAYTLMPPRLLDSNSIYGGCKGLEAGCHGYGIVDTIDVWGGIWKFGEGGMAVVSNQYAAMPSLHFGWSSWCAVTVVLIMRARASTPAVGTSGSPAPLPRRVWWVALYPAATLFCILVTGNHYWLDAFFGGLVMLAGLWIAGRVQAWTDGRSPQGDGGSVETTDGHEPGLSARPPGEPDLGAVAHGFHP
ncbi:MAG: phosphatase PAP2 family protein [Acidimicrobiales bacterium]|nr:phosphatase PAP2 family protein [Acidimicrobiales bacterium]